jgi:hypothetical protein
MRVARDGISRTVFVFRKFVVKVPKLRYGWYYFIVGLCSNIEEYRTWVATKSPLLCPIRWMSWGGWFLVMERADVQKHIDEIRNLPGPTPDPESDLRSRYKVWADAGFGGDDKCDNYGYLGDRLVKVDYPNFSSRSVGVV